MADLRDIYADPTLEAIKRIAVEKRAKEPRREYLGASILGHPCERSVWYEINGTPKEPMGHDGVFATEDGHRTEELIIERLKAVPGIKVYGEQNGFTDMEGRLRGHVDGIVEGLIQCPKTQHILEVKACNEAKFNNLIKMCEQYGEKNALENWDSTYYAQAQIYMGKFGIDRHYLVCATSGGRKMTSCRTEFDKQRFQGLMAKAYRILNSASEPARLGANRDFFVCKSRCSFNKGCWK